MPGKPRTTFGRQRGREEKGATGKQGGGKCENGSEGRRRFSGTWHRKRLPQKRPVPDLQGGTAEPARAFRGSFVTAEGAPCPGQHPEEVNAFHPVESDTAMRSGRRMPLLCRGAGAKTAERHREETVTAHPAAADEIRDGEGLGKKASDGCGTCQRSRLLSSDSRDPAEPEADRKSHPSVRSFPAPA